MSKLANGAPEVVRLTLIERQIVAMAKTLDFSGGRSTADGG
jgi:hypothetical protein